VELAVFALFAVLALLSAIVVVSHRNPVYSVLSLVVTLVSLAVLFVLLGAPFLAALQVLVYTGAILVLFLFVIMLLNVGREEASREGSGRLQKIGAVLAALVFGGLLGGLFWGRFVGFSLAPLSAETVAVRPLAAALMSRYLLPFEMTGLLLLAAVVAATVLARRPTPRSGRGQEGDAS
jgi:NADH-quinone oxidoreductase subunit J